MSGITRRVFIEGGLRRGLLGAAAVSVPAAFAIPFRVSRAAEGLKERAALSDSSPIARLAGIGDRGEFAGDQFARPHATLWRKTEHLASKGGIPAATETASVVVVGGGIAGLSAAYRLKDLRPLLLEQAPRFGGNSKGERWDGLSYSIGAAYLNPPERGTASHALLSELGILPRMRKESSTRAAALVGGARIESFWLGQSDPARAGEFVRVRAKLLEVYRESYPDIPGNGGGKDGIGAAKLRELDRLTFADWARSRLGALHPHVAEYLEEYCWSSFGGGMDELSAAQALSFVCADLNGIVALPGGNAAISEALHQRLAKELPGRNLQTGAIVVDIAPNAGGARVCYETARGKLVSVQARAVVVTAPKFVAARIVSGMPEEQRQAIAKLRYRAYLVANVLLKKRHPSPAFEAYRIAGEPVVDRGAAARKRPFTDLVFGGWADVDRADRSALTLYKAFPYDGGRGELYAADSYRAARAGFEASLPETLKVLGIAPSQVAGLRMARWGHPLPLAAAGLIADGTLERASKPIGKSVFLGQQDNWANPCFESALRSGLEAAAKARAAVGAA